MAGAHGEVFDKVTEANELLNQVCVLVCCSILDDRALSQRMGTESRTKWEAFGTTSQQSPLSLGCGRAIHRARRAAAAAAVAAAAERRCLSRYSCLHNAVLHNAVLRPPRIIRRAPSRFMMICLLYQVVSINRCPKLCSPIVRRASAGSVRWTKPLIRVRRSRPWSSMMKRRPTLMTLGALVRSVQCGRRRHEGRGKGGLGIWTEELGCIFSRIAPHRRPASTRYCERPSRPIVKATTRNRSILSKNAS